MTKRNLWAEVGSVLFFAISVFVLLAIVSFRPEDPSLFTSDAAALAQNLCGRAGAFVASALLHAFGMGAFLLPAALFFVAASLHRATDLEESLTRSLSVLAGMSVAVIALTVLLSLQWKSWRFSGEALLTGGAVGAFFAQALSKQLNAVGGSIAALLVLMIALALSTPLPVILWSGRVVRVSGLLALRLVKLGASYAAYLLSLAAARSARALGVWARESLADLRGRVREWRQAAPTLKSPPAVVAPNRTLPEPVIGLEGLEPAASSEERSYIDMSELKAQVTPPPPPRAAMSGSKGEIKILPPEASAPQTEKPSTRRSKIGGWKVPTMEFLKKPPKIESAIDRERLQSNARTLEQKFRDFDIEGEVTAVRPGPVITLYEFKSGPGVKVSRIAALEDDVAMALSAQSVRILAPIPGKPVVGIEIPSDQREIVYLREFLQHPDFYGPKHSIPVVMGKDIGGQTVLSDLARMPHLLCAGQTGAGKSVFMNGLICSLLYRFTPDELRMILVDPKFIEFRAYQDIPHLLLPVVDDPTQANTALKWAVREMERRYRILAKVGARNLASFNQKVEEMGAAVIRDLLVSDDTGEEMPSSVQSAGNDWLEAFEPDDAGVPRIGKLPYIVVIIDELADLMMVAKKDVEISIARIAQKARAAGIHLVIATQRPSTDVVTGLIKANLPSRVSFQLASFVDSKTILDKSGAERLLGQGDMLFIPPGSSQPARLHGAYVDDDEINKITAFVKSQGKPMYRNEILLDDESDGEDFESEADPKFEEAVYLVKNAGHASASFLQRHLKVGYNRAARMIEDMETRGIVGPADGARPREVLLR